MFSYHFGNFNMAGSSALLKSTNIDETGNRLSNYNCQCSNHPGSEEYRDLLRSGLFKKRKQSGLFVEGDRMYSIERKFLDGTYITVQSENTIAALRQIGTDLHLECKRKSNSEFIKSWRTGRDMPSPYKFDADEEGIVPRFNAKNIMAEVCWICVHSYATGYIVWDDYIMDMIPDQLDTEGIMSWNTLVNLQGDIPDSIKMEFLMDERGRCKFKNGDSYNPQRLLYSAADAEHPEDDEPEVEEDKSMPEDNNSDDDDDNVIILGPVTNDDDLLDFLIDIYNKKIKHNSSKIRKKLFSHRNWDNPVMVENRVNHLISKFDKMSHDKENFYKMFNDIENGKIIIDDLDEEIIEELIKESCKLLTIEELAKIGELSEKFSKIRDNNIIDLNPIEDEEDDDTNDIINDLAESKKDTASVVARISEESKAAGFKELLPFVSEDNCGTISDIEIANNNKKFEDTVMRLRKFGNIVRNKGLKVFYEDDNGTQLIGCKILGKDNVVEKELFIDDCRVFGDSLRIVGQFQNDDIHSGYFVPISREDLVEDLLDNAIDESGIDFIYNGIEFMKYDPTVKYQFIDRVQLEGLYFTAKNGKKIYGLPYPEWKKLVINIHESMVENQVPDGIRFKIQKYNGNSNEFTLVADSSVKKGISTITKEPNHSLAVQKNSKIISYLNDEGKRISQFIIEGKSIR